MRIQNNLNLLISIKLSSVLAGLLPSAASEGPVVPKVIFPDGQTNGKTDKRTDNGAVHI